MSQSLFDNGILLKSFKGVKCWQCTNGKPIHAIRAQELADYLITRPFAGCPQVIKVNGNDFEDKLNNKKGIIFFQNYWQRTGETGRSGDHIDLWDNGTLASNGRLASFFRLNFSSLAEMMDMSDLKRSSSVWFWEIK